MIRPVREQKHIGANLVGRLLRRLESRDLVCKHELSAPASFYVNIQAGYLGNNGRWVPM